MSDRKLRVFESISVDGYFTDARGEIGWAHVGQDDPEFASFVGGNASSGGELLFGRKTYQMMEAFWPSAAAAQRMPDVAKGMNAAKKYVISRTIRPAWSNSHLIEGDAIEEVRRLKATTGPDITILGSGEIASQMGVAGLIDEYQFVIVPIALGAGRTVFMKDMKLRLMNHRAFPGGNLVVTYAVA